MPDFRMAALFAVAVLVAGCGADRSGVSATEVVTRDSAAPGKWSDHPRGPVWTDATLAALEAHGAPLVAFTPDDSGEWCPGYASADPPDRRAFWVGLLSALAEQESTWRPEAVGGDGRWFGLVQISPATARGYGCRAATGDALRSGPANLSCAIRIWTETVQRDGVIADGRGGIAADWGPFSQPRKRSEMQAWLRAQPYCREG